jgi:hypothetical protein
MDEPNVEELINDMKTDTNPPLHIKHVKKILTMLESSIRELQLNSPPHEERQEILKTLDAIKKVLSSEDLGE